MRVLQVLRRFYSCAPCRAIKGGVKTQQIAVYTNYMMIIGGIGNLYGYLTRAFPYDISLSGQLGYVNFFVVGVVTLGSFGMSFFSMKLRGLMNPALTRKLLAIILFCIAAYMCILNLYFIKSNKLDLVILGLFSN